MTYRNPALIRLASQAPRCMLCGAYNEGQVVSAHSNQQRDGKGASLKASDAAIAFVCWTCHGRIDQGNEPRAVRIDIWEAAHRATMRWLIESGHLLVSSTPTAPPVAVAKPSRKIAAGRPIAARVDPWPKGRKLASRPMTRKAGATSNDGGVK